MSERKNKSESKKQGTVPPSPAAMADIFRSCGLALSEGELAAFWAFHQLLRARNVECDLTRLHSFDGMTLRHYVDSGLVAQMLDLPSPLLDIGTGAGFPGVPLKILRPELTVIFAESRGKKLEFLEEANELLNFSDVEIYPHKVTDKFDIPVKGIITRDLEAMVKTLSRAVGFLPLGGRVIFMKGPAAGPEIEAALEEFGEVFELELDRSYSLGNTGHDRRLVVFRRIAGRPAEPASFGRSGYKEVASSKNPGFKLWQKVLEPKGIRKHNLALMSGLKQVAETVRDFPEACVALLGRGPDDPEIETQVDRFRLKPELLRELDLFGAGPPLLVVRVPETPEWRDDDWPEGCTLFVPFQDPNNVGAVIRSAAALGAARVVMLREAAHPFHPKSLRAAGPAVFRIPLFHGPSILELEARGAPLLTLGADGENLAGFAFPPTFGLAPGLEGPGLPRNLRDWKRLSIPMTAGVESLNAALATGLALWEWSRDPERG
ncbi:MAG: 16S rRNA (guanine(527)-N(7))-methyltransferase RsmG [Pseudomonadota bacterium]